MSSAGKIPTTYPYDTIMAKKTATKKSPSRKLKPAAKSPELFSWTSVERESLNPLFDRQFVVGENIMVARVLLKKGCIVPRHSHYHEQVSCIIEGSLKFGFDHQDIIVKAGEVLTIPPHVPHSAEALTDTVGFDIFNPPREDWINKSDQYLRKK